MEISISKQQLIAFFGAILLLIGAFLPVLSVPIVGSISLFNNGKSDGLIIVVLAGIAIVLAIINQIKAIRFVAMVSLIVVLFDLYKVYSKISDAKREMSEKLAGNPFGGMANAMMDTIQLQYGWVVLILGCLILLFGSFFKIVNSDEARKQVRGAISEGRETPVIDNSPIVRTCKFCHAEMPNNSLKCNECGSIN
ncbi:hypothetical protein [Acinetobacter wuhouensis]|uniref:Uncharacterized protein n=1 Tax=Acinetobacter wuhouensis TaxID=1879050 RepID=A0A3G2T2A7_9GAMM|nr:hypothetical protein [Acinetobacter wuhouensis]AYO54201.1 hypothetical protein CDG68_11395 [Acinetobacter wuhouensis]